MKTIPLKKITAYIEKEIPAFHAKRLESLKSLKLKKVLKRKNPYLFRAKHVTNAPDLVKLLLDAHLSSQEETIFGVFLESFAIYACELAYGGQKAPAEGIDLMFARDGIRYLVSIKSGPNWGNSSQIKKMIDNFKTARRILGTNASAQNVVNVNGCCYGQESAADKGTHLKKCGQSFWSLITGDDEFYTKIIEPLGHNAKTRSEEFDVEYGKVRTCFRAEFIKDFCTQDGAIDWHKLLRFNSGRHSNKSF
jgi:hypothetical protein